MNTQADNLLEDFDSHQSGQWDFKDYKKLNQTIKEIIKSNSPEVVPFFICYVQEKKYLSPYGHVDSRLQAILEIFGSYQDSACLPLLFVLAEDPALAQYHKDIIKCLGKFKLSMTRDFFRRNLLNPRLNELCALELANFPDPSGEKILFDLFQKSLIQKNFSSIHFNALILIRNTRIWSILEAYLQKTSSERERYKILESLLKINDMRIIPLLVICYQHYMANDHINYNEAKSISLEGESLFLTKAQKESVPFSKKMRKRIISIFKLYQSDFRVKTLLRKLEV